MYAKLLQFITEVSVMASTAKRSRMEQYDSDDSDCSLVVMEETAGGMDSGEESELDRLLINESDISRWERIEVHEMTPRGSRTAKICSSIAGKCDMSPFLTLDF